MVGINPRKKDATRGIFNLKCDKDSSIGSPNPNGFSRYVSRMVFGRPSLRDTEE